MEQSKEVAFCALNLPAKPSEVTADRRIHVVLNSETSSLSRCPPTVFWYEYPTYVAIWVVTRHRYGILALVSQTHFAGKPVVTSQIVSLRASSPIWASEASLA